MSFNPVENALNYAVVNQNFELVKYLLATNKVTDNSVININAKDQDGNTFLHAAAARDSIEIINLLLKQDKIDVNSRNDKEETPLYSAVSAKRLKIASILQVNGANVFTQDINGKNILLVAVENDDYSLSEWALLHGVNPESATIDNAVYPLDIAIAHNNGKIIELLSLFGALAGKVLPKEIFTMDFNVAYHFVVGSSYLENSTETQIMIPITKDDKNFSLAITELAQFQRAKELLNKIKSLLHGDINELVIFKDENEKYTSFKVLLSCLTFNWKILLKVDHTSLMQLYQAIQSLNENPECKNDYRAIMKLLDTIERSINVTNLDKIDLYSVPSSKIMSKIENGLKNQYSKSLETFLKSLQLHQPIHLKRLIITHINQGKNAGWQRVRQAIHSNASLSKSYSEMGGLSLELSHLQSNDHLRSEINFAIYYLNQLVMSTDNFEQKLNQSFPLMKLFLAAYFFLSLALGGLGGLGFHLEGEKKYPHILLLALWLLMLIASLVSTAATGIDASLFIIAERKGKIPTSFLFRSTIQPLITRLYQNLSIGMMGLQKKETFRCLIIIIEDLLSNMNADNPHAKNLFEVLQSLKNPDLKIKELIGLLNKIKFELSSVSSQLQSSRDQSEETISTAPEIHLMDYHHRVRFYPMKIESLKDRIKSKSLTLSAQYKKSETIVDFQSSASSNDEENNDLKLSMSQNSNAEDFDEETPLVRNKSK